MGKKPKAQLHPMQLIEFDGKGVIRFRENTIVRFLVDWAGERGMNLNDLACKHFNKADWTQLAQLIGYSVSGFGELSYVDKRSVKKADKIAAKLFEANPDNKTSFGDSLEVPFES